MLKCMAHRGFSGKYAENTLLAFQKAIELECVDSMELDVQLSKDGVPVIIHDFRLNRTTNGTGYVKDKSVEELKTFTVESKLFFKQKIPTLEEVLSLCKGKVYLDIELKTAPGYYEGYEKTVIELIQKHKMEEEVCITSFDHQVIKKIKNLNTSIKTGLIVWGNPVLLLEQLKDSGASILAIHHDYLSKELVEEMLNNQIEIVTWTVNRREDMKRVLSLSTQIKICTNHPDIFNEVISTI